MVAAEETAYIRFAVLPEGDKSASSGRAGDQRALLFERHCSSNLCGLDMGVDAAVHRFGRIYAAMVRANGGYQSLRAAFGTSAVQYVHDPRARYIPAADEPVDAHSSQKE